jgi:YHS domain-containing protein
VVKVSELSRKTYSKMVQNLWWAGGYNIIALPLAAGILSSYGIIVSPAIGALIMSLSTIIVAINTQTLRQYEPQIAEFKEKKHITTDPVCGMPVDPEKAYSKIEHEEYVLYFCSKQCEEAFQMNPAQFLAKLKTETSVNSIPHHH